MLEAENLEASLLPLVYVSIVFGVAPCLPTCGKPLKFLSILFSLIALAFVLTLMILFIMEHNNYYMREEFQKFVTNVPMKLTYVIGLINIMVSVATHIPHRSNITFSKIIEILTRIDEDLQMDKGRHYTKTKRVLSAIVVGSLVWHLAHREWSSDRLGIVCTLVPFVMWNLIVIQYIVLAALLKQRFEWINKSLMNTFGFPDIADDDLSVLHLAEMSRIRKRRWLIDTKSGMKNKGLLLILDLLQETHATLTDLIHQVNSLYATSNATFFIANVTFGTLNLYSIIAIIFAYHTSWVYDFLITQILSLTLSVTDIFVYSVVCGETSVVARRPVLLVETLKLHLGAHQQIIVERLDLFSQHIQETRYRFTAYSLVTFDYSLLGTFACTVTMYLIILVQMALSSNSIKHMFQIAPSIGINESSILETFNMKPETLI